MARVALGFCAHTGWAAVVGLAGPAGSPRVVCRQRVDLEDRRGRIPVQVYHAVAGRPEALAVELVRRAEQAASDAAAAALGELAGELAAGGHAISSATVLLGSTRLPETIGAILASHVLCHAAEGELYREALLAAAGARGLHVAGVEERDLAERAKGELAVMLAALGKAAGPPWGRDYKLAAAGAWLALPGGAGPATRPGGRSPSRRTSPPSAPSP